MEQQYEEWSSAELREAMKQKGIPRRKGDQRAVMIAALRKNDAEQGEAEELGEGPPRAPRPQPEQDITKEATRRYEEARHLYPSEMTAQEVGNLLDQHYQRIWQERTGERDQAQQRLGCRTEELPARVKMAYQNFKKFQDGMDNMDEFLQEFEQQCGVQDIPYGEWAKLLLNKLTGRASAACGALPREQAQDYKYLCTVLLSRYTVTPETFLDRFRGTTKGPADTHVEVMCRLRRACTQWWSTQGAITAEQILEVVLMEQFLNICSSEVGEWLQDQKPTTADQAAALADRFISTRAKRVSQGTKPSLNTGRGPREVVPARSAPEMRNAPWARPVKTSDHRGTKSQPAPRTQWGTKPMSSECYNCNQRGHFAKDCPQAPKNSRGPPHRHVHYLGEWTEGPASSNAALWEPEAEGGYSGVYTVRNPQKLSGEQHRQAVWLQGRQATGYRDSGSAVTVVLPKWVRPTDSIRKEMWVMVAGGEQLTIPMARVNLDWGMGNQSKEVGVMDGLPADVLLGNDLGHMTSQYVQPITRAQAKSTHPGEAYQEQRGYPRPEVSPLLANTLTLGWAKGEEIRAVLQKDETLAGLRDRAAQGKGVDDLYSVIWDKGLLYRVKVPINNEVGREPRKQLVVPQLYRGKVLQVAHEIPLGGHLGEKKTRSRVKEIFFWPGLDKDVKEFCHSCDACQRNRPLKKNSRAKLQSLPVMEEPFQRVAVDIIGPLARASRTGKQYILTLVDYATRYPEAVALSSITAPKVADALVTIFTRTGFPHEILSDQGPQFMAKVTEQLWATCGVKHITSSPYHPQTNGLCERFNGTLKHMIRTFTDQEPDWERLLPCLLFAYREVPQESTGHSPFELLYGRHVRGPLSIIRETWEGEYRQQPIPVATYVLAFRENMSRLTGIVSQNMRKAQQRDQKYYKAGTSDRILEEGTKVLMLEPHPQNKLQSQWVGPYTISQKVGNKAYVVMIDPDRAITRVAHINRLKVYVQRAAHLLAICRATEDEPEEGQIPDMLNKADQDTVGESIQQTLELDAEQKEQLSNSLKPFHSLFTTKPGCTPLAVHPVVTGECAPLKQHPYRVPEAVRANIQAELRTMLQLGVIEESSSPWASPVVLVPKKDGTTRFCVDYRRLNDKTKTDAYPVPRMDELLDRLGTAKYLTTLDLSKGYWQIPLEETAKEKSAFITPFGLFQFKVMPFGMKNAPSTFQRLVDTLLQGHQEYAQAYLDDIAIFSQTWEDHIRHISQIMQAIHQAKLTIRPDKCQWARAEVQYLGHWVGNGKLRPEPAKVEGIAAWPTPKTKKQVMAFLGTTGYYRKFIPDFSSTAKPLTDLTKKKLPREVNWTSACQLAFQTLKDALTCSPVLAAPDYNRPFVVQTDASMYGIGAVLSQPDNQGVEHPVAYISRKLLQRETAYATIEKECLAVVWALRKLQHYLYGRQFTVTTDHNPLCWLSKVAGENGRLLRWSLALQTFNFTVQHRKGKFHQNADGLSRQLEP